MERSKLMAKRTKQEIIENIIEDLESNFYDSKEFIMSLCKEALQRRTRQELIDFYQIEEEG